MNISSENLNELPLCGKTIESVTQLGIFFTDGSILDICASHVIREEIEYKFTLAICSIPK